MRTTRLRVTLLDVEPTVVRVLDVPAGVLLTELHELLQAGIGWTDSHLHQFVCDGVSYGIPDPDWPADGELDEADVALRALPACFRYLYDFGDGWEHRVEVLGPGEETPGCVAGEGACPPEDVGGPVGYTDFREALADPGHPEHDVTETWAGEWRGFDQASTDLLVRQMVGVVPAPVRLVLELTAGGVRLTPGGRLPRSFVRAVQARYPRWHLLEQPAAIEEDLPPLASLHELLRRTNLLRLRHGVLSPTRAADDEMEVVRRLRRSFGSDDGFVAVLAGVCIASLSAGGPAPLDELASRVLPLVGDRWVTSDGKPLDERRTRIELSGLWAVLTGLDLIETDRDRWSAGPSARWLLPRATALARLWSPGR